MLEHLTGQSDSVRSNVGCLHYPGPSPSCISDRRGNWGRQRRSPRQGTVWRRCTSARTLPLRAARSNCSKGSWDTRRDSPPQGSCGWQRQHMERRASNGRSCSRGSWAQIWVQACRVPLGLGNDNYSQHSLQYKPSSPSGLSTRFIE